MRYTVLFEGSVFAMAEVNKEARTGVYFVLLNLAEALLDRLDVSLGIITVPQNFRLLKQALSSHRLVECVDRASQIKVGEQNVAYISTFFPIHPAVRGIKRLAAFQIIHDLACHACPSLSGNMEFEKAVVASLGSDAHALCVSQNTREDLTRLFGIPTRRSSVFYPAIRRDIQLSAARSPDEMSQIRNRVGVGNAPYILTLSTLEPRKNLSTALRAFVDACELLQDVNLHFVLVGIAGWGNQLALLESVPEKLRSRIKTLGYVDDNLIPALLCGAVCLLYPSLYEGFGLPPLEAMSCGTPVIVSNAGSLPEVVSYGGRIVGVYEHMEMARIIKNWICSPEDRLEWSRKGLKRARDFSWDKAAASILHSIRATAVFRR
jgi:glycosyltransferase involved in cell wall biosynthesis